MKADFFRYCILYKYGGIYLDIKSSIKVPNVFGNIIMPDDEGILDIKRIDEMYYRINWDYGSYEQWFLVYAPYHPYLKSMIHQIFYDINNRIEFYHGKSFKEKVLRLTGPYAYVLAIHNSILKQGMKVHREISYFRWLRYRKSSFNEYKHSKHIYYSDATIDTSLYTTNHNKVKEN